MAESTSMAHCANQLTITLILSVDDNHIADTIAVIEVSLKTFSKLFDKAVLVVFLHWHPWKEE